MIREQSINPVDQSGRRGPKKAARLNRHGEYVASLSRDVARNLRVRSQSLILVEMFLGKTTDTEDTPLYDDARYEVQRHRPKWSLGTNDLLDLELDRYPYQDQQVITATNVSEMVAGTHSLPVDTPVFVVGVIIPKDPRALQYFFISGGVAGFFLVKVTQTGGADGDASNPCTYTYSVYQTDGTTLLGTGIEVIGPRPNGMTTPPSALSYGQAVYDENNALKLWSTLEKPNDDTCS